MLKALQLGDKVALLGNEAQMVPDVGLPAYEWWCVRSRMA